MGSDLGLLMAVETMEAMAEVGDVGDPSVVVYRLVEELVSYARFQGFDTLLLFLRSALADKRADSTRVRRVLTCAHWSVSTGVGTL
jgi:hypothetical protein